MKLTYLKVFGHIISAIWQVAFYFPRANTASKNRRIKNWCKKLLKILEINLITSGFDSLPNGGILFASNHISWLDIMVINAILPVRFVAKSEVKKWPIIGYLADQLNTLYIHRNDRGDVKKMVVQLVDALNDGQLICIFPEGTSSDGTSVLGFRSNLFEAVIDSKASCMPIAISYHERKSSRITSLPAYFGDMSLITSINNLVKSQPIDVIVSVCAITQVYQTRKELSQEAWGMVNEMRQTNFSAGPT
jgi:1-acyl-sn-glycerol-3-phosphate acyltransferase